MEREKIVEAMARAIAQAESCHPDDWQHFTEQAQAALTALEALGLVVVPRELILFLGGVAPLEGVWFGDPHPRGKGAFWWRKYLPAAPQGRG